jgi:uncharacterized protein involved in tolerance to divalent cations
MIQLHIITNDPKMVKEIIELLLNNDLVVSITVKNTLSSYKSKSGQINTVMTNLLIGRTKASLFNTIEKLLFAKYGENIPEIYAMSIVNMDFTHLKKLRMLVNE